MFSQETRSVKWYKPERTVRVIQPEQTIWRVSLCLSGTFRNRLGRVILSGDGSRRSTLNAKLFLHEADICPAVWLQGTVRQWSPALRCHEHPHQITTLLKHQSPACVSCLYSASRKLFLKFTPSTAGNLLPISTLDLLTTHVVAVCFSKLSSSLKSSTAKEVFGCS